MCIALLSALVIGLAFKVSMTRGKTNTLYGYNADPADIMYKAVRAHGNAVEYAPTIALLIYVLSLASVAAWVQWCMVLVTIFRYSAAIGILASKTMAKPNPMRLIGAIGTYICGFALCVALFLRAANA
jgi:uncharacterized membrane protein YecN with MAPEG domain